MKRTLLQSTVVAMLIVNLFAVTCAGMHTEVGIEWIKEEGVHVEDASTPEVVELEDGTYRMYFGCPDGICSALSSDGLEWTLEEGVRLAPGDYYDSHGVAGPDIVQLPDGSFRMYYQGTHLYASAYIVVILSAMSSDGLTWLKESGVRIDRGGPYDRCHASSPEVVKLPDGSYRMYYSGSNRLATSGERILSAVSSSGITWTKEPGIRIDKGIIYDSFSADYPDVAELSDGSYRMY